MTFINENIIHLFNSANIENTQLGAVLLEEELKQLSITKTEPDKKINHIITALFNRLIEILKSKDFDSIVIVNDILSGEIEKQIQKSYENFCTLKETIIKIPDNKNNSLELFELLEELLYKMVIWFPQDGDIYNKILLFNQICLTRVSPFFFYKYLEIDINTAVKNGDITGEYCLTLGYFVNEENFKIGSEFVLDCFEKLMAYIQEIRPEPYEMSIDDINQEKARDLMKSIKYALDNISTTFSGLQNKNIEFYPIHDRTRKLKELCRKELLTWVF